MITSYAQWVIRWRWPILLLTFIWIGFAASGVRFLEFSTDYRDFFGEKNPQLQAFEELQDTYTKSDYVLMLITPKDGRVFTPQTMESVRWLTEEAWQVPYSRRVDSLTNFQHTKAFEDDLMVGDLVPEPLQLSPEQLAEIRTIALAEPLIIDRLVDAQASVTAVIVTIQLPGEALDEVPTVAAFVRELEKELEARDSNLTVGLSGTVMMNNSFGESSEKDITTLVPLMFLTVIVVLGLLLRSVSASVTTIAVIFMSIFAGMGLLGWSGIKLTSPTASAPIIILTMAVADAVHLLSTFFHGLRNNLSKHDAMVESMRINFQPVLLTSVTTIIGFLSINFSEVPPLRHMGNTVAVGVLAAFILSITFLPALMVMLPVKAQAHAGRQKKAMTDLSRFVVKNRRPLLWVMSLIAIGFIALIPRNEINDDFVKYFDETVQFRIDSDYASEHLVGASTIEYSLDSGVDGGISDPAYLAKLQQFVDYLHGLQDVTHVYSITDIFKRLNMNLHGDDPDYYVLPEERELAAQYLLLYEMSLPYGLDLNDQINVTKSATRIRVSLVDQTSKHMLQLEQQLGAWLHENMPEIRATAASTSLMFAHIGQRNAKSLTFGAAIALVLISMLLIVALRSRKIGTLSLVPNLVPVGIAFGVWALISGQVGMSLSIVAGMTLGIVVDDTVHFLSKYLRARREKGLSSEEAIHYAFTSVGMALIVTTVVLISGFLVLTFSSFKINSDMGLLTSITIGIALVMDFLLLPPLLMKLDGKNYE
ncbi:MAG: MMPL family transporter [Proteobacteria bacterium]|nr:MMPL family transporter [Pseudomonadota bacterium]